MSQPYTNLPTLAQIRSLAAFKPLKPKQRRFIIAYSGCGKVSVAASLAKVSWIQHYRWAETDLGYKQAFEQAREIFADAAEGEIFNRAFFGEDRNVWNKGQLLETVKQKSDILAMFALKGLRPQYRDNFAINNFAGPVQLNIKHSTQLADPLEQTALPAEETKVE